MRPASVHRLKAAVRSFFAWTTDAGLTSDNHPARSVRMKRLSQKPPVFLTASEKKALLKEVKSRAGVAGLRDRVMIEVLLGTGIRIGELESLDTDDIDLDAKHLRVRAKGHVVQVKFIKTDLRILLKRYLKERSRQNTTQGSALFLSNRGTRGGNGALPNSFSKPKNIHKICLFNILRHIKTLLPSGHREKFNSIHFPETENGRGFDSRLHIKHSYILTQVSKSPFPLLC
jgi:site-specific recombinase XerC